VRIGGQRIDDKIITRIQGVIDANPKERRGALSREICEQLKWRSRNGRLREVSCRKILSRLHRDGKIRLQEAEPFKGKRKPRLELEQVRPEEVKDGTLRDFQPVELIAIGSADSEASRIWNDLMDRHHYLGSGPLCGGQLRYLIRSEKHGWIGALSFSGAAWSVQKRDQWIGWSRHIREKNLNQIVANSRFLITPQWRVPHLASHVLALAMKRLRADWRGRYGYEPVLVETFIDKERFEGTCYRAANWIEVGETQGRGRQDSAHRRGTSVKRIFVYPLDQRARERLCEGVTAPTIAAAKGKPEDWAEAEFGSVDLGDRRLNRRLLEIARDFYARPQAQVPQACQTRARTKAAYRFFKHPNTNMDDLLEPHRESTYKRITEKKIVLCPQDTTSLNYSTHPATENLGPIGSMKEGIIGLIVHDTMAFSLEGTPLGLLDVQCWARDAKEFGKKHQRKQRTIEEKESYKWLRSFQSVAEAQRQCPDTMLVSMGDREADIYELFHLALQDPSGPKLLVRAEQDRLLEDAQGHLWPVVAAQPEAGIQEIHVPRRGTIAARVARLAVRFAEVTLKPPKDKSKYGPLKLWAVLAQEIDAPKDIAPLCWMLLTTCRVTTFEEATEKLAWYTKRWGIEIYHKTLKSGCQIEERQLGDADTIEACLSIDMVVAWRVYHMTKLGREVPDVPCTVFCEEDDWKALTSFILRRPIVDGTPLTAREYVRMVASLGGFLGRKCDGEPGTKSIWLGQQRLGDIKLAYQFFVPQLRPPPVPGAYTYGAG
jgi:Domain of unknown function (DUF4338)/Transposase DNA-binding/Transposase Tn5 dimerisation domain